MKQNNIQITKRSLQTTTFTDGFRKSRQTGGKNVIDQVKEILTHFFSFTTENPNFVHSFKIQ